MIPLLAVTALAGCDRTKPKAVAKKETPVVLFARPTVDTVQDSDEFTGHIDSIKTVEVRARVTGYLDKVLFEDGEEVKEGAELFEIDPRPYQAEYDRAEATLKQAVARDSRLSADHGRAQRNYQRGAISREEYDKVAGDYAEAEAAVGMARAARDLAKLNVGFTKVYAPIGGRISRRLVDPGNLVQADQTPLTTIVTLDPMFVYFDIDERTMLQLRRLVQEGKLTARQEGGQFPIQVGLSDETSFPHRGTINFSENKLDAATGTLRVRGAIPNPAPRVLSPGMFARVRLPIGHPRKAILIPEQAVGTDQGRKYLYVINNQDEIDYRPIKTGSLSNGLRVVDAGLKADERVVVVGQQRIRPGAKVKPKKAEELVLKASAEPAAPGAVIPPPASGDSSHGAVAAKKPASKGGL